MNFFRSIVQRQAPRRMFPQLLPISQPIRSQRFACFTAPSTAHVHSKLDILVWFEICELAPNGEYIPVVIDHLDESPCRGTFLLKQGIQRRIRISIIHEAEFSVTWKEIRELVVGRVRVTPELSDEYDDDEDESVLSLSLFPGEHYIDGDDRSIFRFEAAWDTSLHNNILLNRVTPSGERIYLTMSAYVEVSILSRLVTIQLTRIFPQQLDQCTQPTVITKDICVTINGRDARIFPRLSPNAKALKQLLSGAYRNSDSNHQSAVYELLLKRAIDTGSPGVQRRQRRVLDTSATYVRGEENLSGWQPRNDSLIFDHQWELEKIRRIELVERVRHVLMVREKLSSEQPSEDIFCGMKQSNSRMNLAALTSPSNQIPGVADESVYEPWEMNDRERELCSKCVYLIQTHIPSKPGPQATHKKNSLLTPTNIEEVELLSPVSSSPELMSPEKPTVPTSWTQRSGVMCSHSPQDPTSGNGLSLADLTLKPTFVPDMEEIRVSPMVSRKGFLYIFENIEDKWVKKWLVVKRPYMFIFNDDTDPVERGLINLSNAEIDYSIDREKIFTLITKSRNYQLQTTSEKEVHEWLYAINPLIAGEMRSKSSRENNKGPGEQWQSNFESSEPGQCSI